MNHVVDNSISVAGSLVVGLDRGVGGSLIHLLLVWRCRG